MKKAASRVLIIEDEKAMVDALDLKLSREEFVVTCAYDGNDGLARAQKEPFDCIILDIVMPKADGFFVLEELKKKQDAPPVIVLTNLSQGEDERRAKGLGAKKFFVKTNISINDIVTEVRKAIGE